MLKPSLKTKDITLKKTTRIILAHLALTVGLTSCGTLTHKEPTNTTSTEADATAKQVSWKDRESSLSAIKSWQINGKIAVQTPKQSGSATVNWVQRASQFNISMMGPLGAGSLKLYGRPGFVTLQTSDGKTFTDKNPEHLLAKGWGYNLPLSNLNYWIRGLPSPNLAMSTHFDSYGRLSTLIQQGWIIQYLGYTHRGSVDLPDRINISSPSLKVRIVIYQWQT